MTEYGDISDVWEGLVQDGGKIVYLVLDGGGGLADPFTVRTALQGAQTPNLDRIASASETGLMEPVGPGITPGSGPGHLALFGYDPLRYRIGRGVLSALGVNFELREGDVAARVNFATSEAGKVVDRRAGRLDSNVNRHLCKKVLDSLELKFDGELYLETVSEHRAVLVLRGEGLGGELTDTDPQATGREPLPPEAQDEGSRRTAELVNRFLEQAHRALAGEPANTLLLRGFQRYSPLPSIQQRFGLRGLCLAQYPMYRGVSRLLGMQLGPRPESVEAMFEVLQQRYHDEDIDLFFLHVKGTDKAGEDGDWVAKVAVIEEVDRLLPRVLAIDPDVLVITSDHSTPAVMGRHSWHPVPTLIRSQYARIDATQHFDEMACATGSLGLRPGLHLMGLALANAGRLKKFGA
ncbi:2,3-bisphosphoglycerate-independent phosphoglycerate mutase [Thiohalomonas denitrificans]|uniref:2,3-bisphosphoglycerate-independent phosphoglycerate mutase n=1 Tax=Thiohalomonas denitrificans TaxID=415747 RepID=UPI0026E9AB72|nr:2,3-bisphosphoglycerate-independent phosphoglycerate mutase [Thiohalomonas denitrificans]